MERIPQALPGFCPVYLSPATTESKRIRLNQLNAETGNRLKQQLIDSETGEVVERDQIAKGYEYERGRYVTLDDDELKALQIESSKIIDLSQFVSRDEVDPVYLDAPYYVYPDGALLQALQTSVLRGVEVTLVVPLTLAVIRSVAVAPTAKVSVPAEHSVEVVPATTFTVPVLAPSLSVCTKYSVPAVEPCMRAGIRMRRSAPVATSVWNVLSVPPARIELLEMARTRS